MSKLTINFSQKAVKHDGLELPIFLENDRELYQLVENNDGSINLVSLQGYKQIDFTYESIKGFFLDSRSENFRVVDIEINVK